MCVFYQSVIPGKNIGYDVYKEIKGEEDFHKKMKEADKVKAVLCVLASYWCKLDHYRAGPGEVRTE